ncbi:peptide transporter [Bacillus sp. VT 712]|uniref:peptide MFS transporter n=1 Tax=Bacillus sp. VT 712 TaxID=1848047 RepID=UPI0007A486CC|nr:peptide MFS transporter [Bacillus sp. VT 712]KZB92306.1 peptide transporter [Bacillus sp. VT 712]
MSLDKEKIVQSVPQKGFFGHPKGLFTLFFTEFWERFSYYGMKALLIVYLYTEVSKGGLGIDNGTAASIMSIYGALVYMSGIIGGWIADRILGTSRTVFWGGVLIMIGHIVLALPAGFNGVLVAMLFIILGTGLLKPNVSSVVGDLYRENDNRRDAAFSIFYMGINLGAFIAPLIVSTLGENYGFHLGFGAAAVGMLGGLIVFSMTKKKNLGLAGTEVPNPLKPGERKKTFGIIGLIVAVLVIFLIIAGVAGFLTLTNVIAFISFLAVIIPIIYFTVMYRSSKTTDVERSRLLAYIPLFISAVMFWAIQEQGSTILAIYAETSTQLTYGSFTIPVGWFQSLNPLFIILLAPVFARLWVTLGDRQPSTPQKFSLGLLFAGFSFLVMVIPSVTGDANHLTSPLWLVLSFFLVVIGELCLSPGGLSTTTKLAPKAFSAQTMSLWFLASAAAQAINAQIVRFYEGISQSSYFGLLGGISVVLGIIIFLSSSKIKQLMKGIN